MTQWDRAKAKNLGSEPSLFFQETIVKKLQDLGHGTAIDLGCFNGRILRYLLRNNFDAYGTDVPGTKDYLDVINEWSTEAGFGNRAFVTDYNSKLQDTLPISRCDTVIMWRVVHLLSQNDLRTLLLLIDDVMQADGRVIMSARMYSDKVALHESWDTSWPGVTQGKLRKESPKRLYFHNPKSLRDYIYNVAPDLQNRWEYETDFAHEFFEHEPTIHADDKKQAAPCVCAGFRLV